MYEDYATITFILNVAIPVGLISTNYLEVYRFNQLRERVEQRAKANYRLKSVSAS
jgi:hypothetical protein